MDVRDQVHRLKTLPKMDNSSATKAANFVTETLGSVNHLKETLKDDQESVLFLLFVEIITPN